MITFLDGKLVSALPTHAIIDVGGVGYEVFIPLSSYDRLPRPGQPIHILTHLAVREDAHVLYGFMTPAERDLFRLLVNNVSGIGPKLALAVLSGMSVKNFKSRGRELRCCCNFKDQRAGQKNGGANRPGIEGQARRGGGMGSSQRDACTDARARAGQRGRTRVDRARLQTESMRTKQSATCRRKAKRNRRKNWSSWR